MSNPPAPSEVKEVYEPLPLMVIRRRVTAAVNEYNRAIILWRDLAVDGLTALGGLVNAHFEARYVNVPEMWHAALDEYPDIKDRFRVAAGARVKARQDLLDTLVAKMELQIDKMRIQSQVLHHLSTQGRKQHGDTAMMENPLFLTWSLDRLSTVLGLILEQYEREMRLKKQIATDITKETDRDGATVWMSSWLNAPELNETQLTQWSESVLIESRPA